MRADEIVAEIERVHPDAWEQVEGMRESRRELGGWPSWCYVPIAGTLAVASGGGQPTPEHARFAAVLSAAAAWRAKPWVWRVEGPTRTRPTDALEAPMLLAGLPRWATWLEIEGLLSGWVHLEHDVNTGRPELRLVLDHPEGLLPVPVLLHLGSVEESAAVLASQMAGPGASEAAAAFRRVVGAHLSAVVALSRSPAMAQVLRT